MILIRGSCATWEAKVPLSDSPFPLSAKRRLVIIIIIYMYYNYICIFIIIFIIYIYIYIYIYYNYMFICIISYMYYYYYCYCCDSPQWFPFSTNSNDSYSTSSIYFYPALLPEALREASDAGAATVRTISFFFYKSIYYIIYEVYTYIYIYV